MDPAPYLDALRARDRRVRELRRARARAVRSRLPELVQRLAAEFGIGRVVLFGSLLTSELYEDSDVDLAVAGLAASAYWRALDVACTVLGVPVDLVPLEEASSALAERVAREGEVLLG
jgi:predicted nucleotidyltransferase